MACTGDPPGDCGCMACALTLCTENVKHCGCAVCRQALNQLVEHLVTLPAEMVVVQAQRTFPTLKTDDTKAEPDEKVCAVCLENKVGTHFMPCGHVVMCRTCVMEAERVRTTPRLACPLCKAEVHRVHPAYV